MNNWFFKLALRQNHSIRVLGKFILISLADKFEKRIFCLGIFLGISFKKHKESSGKPFFDLRHLKIKS